MQEYQTAFDLMANNLKKALDTKAKYQAAQTQLQNSLLLAKVKAQYESALKGQLQTQKFNYDMTTKKTMTPLDEAKIKESDARANYYNTGKPANSNVKESIIAKMSRGEELTPGDLQIWNDVIKRPERGASDSDKFRTFYNDISTSVEKGMVSPEEGWNRIQRSYPDKMKDLIMGGVGLSSLKKLAPKAAGINDKTQKPAQLATFNTPEDADNSGLASGTIVMVGDRRYQI